MTPKDIIDFAAAQYGETIDDEWAEMMIWSCTGFPCFWNIPRQGRTPTECFYRQIHHAIRWFRRYGWSESKWIEEHLDKPLENLKT